MIIEILKEIKDILNEFQLLPYGRIDIEGEPPAYVDEDSIASVIAHFNRRGNDMVIDYEHQTLKDVQAPAAGWIKNLEDRGQDGLWAVVEWTERAEEYLKNKEYRYFSPVFWVTKEGRKVVRIENVALTNYPKINQLRPIVAKLSEEAHATQERRKKFKTGEFKQEAKMKKLKKILKLADDATEDQILDAVEKLVAKAEKPGPVACKEVLKALNADGDADVNVVISKIEELKAPADVAQKLSQEVANLKSTIAKMNQEDLVEKALKEGKTSPEELDAWGRELAEKSPEQFEKIVLARPAGSVVPVQGLKPAGDKKDKSDEIQMSINKMLGVDEESWKKYGPQAEA